MAKYYVDKAFVDKDTLVPYSVGDIFESENKERVKLLKEEGFLKTNEKKEKASKEAQ
jgi:hypothetical protein